MYPLTFYYRHVFTISCYVGVAIHVVSVYVFMGICLVAVTSKYTVYFMRANTWLQSNLPQCHPRACVYAYACASVQVCLQVTDYRALLNYAPTCLQCMCMYVLVHIYDCIRFEVALLFIRLAIAKYLVSMRKK